MKKLITIATAVLLTPLLLAQSATPAKKKKSVSKKPVPYVKLAEAKATSLKAEEPIVAFLFLDDDKKSETINEKVLKRKEFMKEFAKPNFTVWAPLPFKRAATKSKINIKQLAPDEREFMEKTIVTPKMVEQARQAGQTPPECDDASLYPIVMVLLPGATQEVYRFPKFDEDGGFAVWLMTMRDKLAENSIEPVITKPIQNILDNPLADSKKANASQTQKESKKGKKKKK